MNTRIPGVLFEAVAEAPAGGGGESLGEPVEAAALPVEAAPDLEPAGATGAEAPNYDAIFGTPEGREALQRALYEQGLVQPPGYEEPYTEPEAGDPFAEFDFLADDAPQQLAAILEENNRRLLEAIQGSPALVAAEQQHHEAWATSQFGAIEAELGTELPQELRELAITMAAGQRPPDGHPGLGHFDPGRALHESARTLHSMIQRERNEAVRAYQAGASGGGTPGAGEPPAGGVGAVHSERVPENMREAREAWERRQGLRD